MISSLLNKTNDFMYWVGDTHRGKTNAAHGLQSCRLNALA